MYYNEIIIHGMTLSAFLGLLIVFFQDSFGLICRYFFEYLSLKTLHLKMVDNGQSVSSILEQKFVDSLSNKPEAKDLITRGITRTQLGSYPFHL